MAFEDLQDPEAIANWPRTLGRDGARTPMPWTKASAFAGFSQSRPWLPVGQGHAELAAAEQESNPDSVLNSTQAMVKLRAGSAALRFGEVDFPETPDPLLALRRTLGGETVLCLFNLGTEDVAVPGELTAGAKPLISSAPAARTLPMTLPGTLPRHGVWIGRL